MRSAPLLWRPSRMIDAGLDREDRRAAAAHQVDALVGVAAARRAPALAERRQPGAGQTRPAVTGAARAADAALRPSASRRRAAFFFARSSGPGARRRRSPWPAGRWPAGTLDRRERHRAVPAGGLDAELALQQLTALPRAPGSSTGVRDVARRGRRRRPGRRTSECAPGPALAGEAAAGRGRSTSAPLERGGARRRRTRCRVGPASPTPGTTARAPAPSAATMPATIAVRRGVTPGRRDENVMRRPPATPAGSAVGFGRRSWPAARRRAASPRGRAGGDARNWVPHSCP